MTATLSDRLIREAYHVAGLGLAEQDEFAQLYLDTAQGTAFRDLCVRVRRGLSDQRRLDACVEIVTGEANVPS